MKSKPSLIQIISSIRKVGGRPSVALSSKKAKARSDRNSWKKEQW